MSTRTAVIAVALLALSACPRPTSNGDTIDGAGDTGQAEAKVKDGESKAT